MDGSANGQGTGGGHGIIRIRTNSVDTDSARETVPALWDELRRRRTEAGLDVREAARRAGLSVVTVEAIEAGAVERLPIGEPGRREVTSLCKALGTDPAPYLDDMREQLRPALASRFERQRPANRRSRLVVFGLVWAVVAVGFTASWLIGRDRGTTADPPTTTSTANEAEATTTGPPPSTAVPATTAPAAAPGGDHAVAVVASRDDVWVRAVTDGKEVQAGMVRQGDRVDVTGRSVDVVVAKPASVDVTVDGAAVPPTPEMHFGE